MVRKSSILNQHFSIQEKGKKSRNNYIDHLNTVIKMHVLVVGIDFVTVKIELLVM